MGVASGVLVGGGCGHVFGGRGVLRNNWGEKVSAGRERGEVMDKMGSNGVYMELRREIGR